MKRLALAIAVAGALTPATVYASAPYSGPSTNVCASGDVYVGSSSAPIMCWAKNECPHLLSSGVDAQGCNAPSIPSPTPKPAPHVGIFPGEHIGTKVVHPVPTPAPQILAAAPDKFIYFAGSYWSY